jgi:hypothetical protein
MATPHQKHTALEFELFHTFLEADWYEFRTVGTKSVTNQIPRSRRSQFADSFQALTRAGCREDVLFSCVLVFLNSQISGVDFPWAKTIRADPNWPQEDPGRNLGGYAISGIPKAGVELE